MFDSNDNSSPHVQAAARAIKGRNLYFAPSVSNLDFW